VKEDGPCKEKLTTTVSNFWFIFHTTLQSTPGKLVFGRETCCPISKTQKLVVYSEKRYKS
jgi:hypothetical protein